MRQFTVRDTEITFSCNTAEKDVVFYDPRRAPFEINGVFYENGRFRRMPEAVARTVSEGVYSLHSNTAGGRVRFITDSPYVVVYVRMPAFAHMVHFAQTGSSGLDIYSSDRYVGSFAPPLTKENEVAYDSCVWFRDKKDVRELTVNMPLYSDVAELYIGVRECSVISAPRPFGIKKPIVYYGSSITQGACASRPGLSYQSMLSRRFDADYINLGFSGNAKAEDEISEYIAALDPSVFVYDYDHNAPTAEHLERTHEKLFMRFRRSHPDTPVVMMTRPRVDLNDDDELRRAIVYRTFRGAKDRGDKNVYFLDGPALMAIAGYDGTPDDLHPNDLGFYSMATALGNVLERIFVG